MQSGDRFGTSVKFDGNTLVVGTNPMANNSPGASCPRCAVYVFTRPAEPNTARPLQARLTPEATEDQLSFGQVVALSGNYIAIGSPNSFTSSFRCDKLSFVRGTHTVQALYSGSNNHAAASSAIVTHITN